MHGELREPENKGLRTTSRELGRRSAREKAEETRELQAQQRLETLRDRWTRADKQVTDIKQSAQKAAGDRVATWRARRGAAALVRQQPQSLLEHVRQHLGKAAL